MGVAILLEANRNIAGQFRLGQQSASVAGELGGLRQTVLVASVQVPGDLRRVVQGPRRPSAGFPDQAIHESAGSQRVLEGGVLQRAGTYQTHGSRTGRHEVLSQCGEIAKGGDMDGIGLAARFEGAGAVGGGHDDFPACHAVPDKFSR